MSQLDTTDVTAYMQTVGKQARAASRALAAANTGDKNSALMAIHEVLKDAKQDILSANNSIATSIFTKLFICLSLHIFSCVIILQKDFIVNFIS